MLGLGTIEGDNPPAAEAGEDASTDDRFRLPEYVGNHLAGGLEGVWQVRRYDYASVGRPFVSSVSPELNLALKSERELNCMMAVQLARRDRRADVETAALPEDELAESRDFQVKPHCFDACKIVYST